MKKYSTIFFIILLLFGGGCIETPSQSSSVVPTTHAPATTQEETPTPTTTVNLTETQSAPHPADNLSINPAITPIKAVKGNVQVHFIDVGQGDAILIETPGHDAVLIDGGNNGKGNTILAYLQKEGIADIDYLIATHPDADHIGGLDEIMDGFPASVVYDNGENKTTKTYGDYLSRAQKSDYEVVKKGFSFTLDGVNFQVLHPSSSFKTEVNENSVVIRATYGNVDFLFTGDCEHSCEQDLLNSGAILDSEILKVGHHGSKTSTSDSFLDAVAPEIAVISVGDGNGYGHPYQGTLDKLSSIEYYRTDLHGTVVIETDGVDYRVMHT